jgi:hypothetical protein
VSEELTLAQTLELATDASRPVATRLDALDALRARLVRQNLHKDAAAVARVYIDTALAEGIDDAEHYNMMFDAYRTLAPYDLHAFFIAVEWDRPVSHRFYLPRVKVLRPLADALTDMFVYDQYDILMFSMPPRVGKTTLGIFTIAWLIGRDSDSPILATAYSEKIVKIFHHGVMEIHSDPQYRYRDIFPNVKLVDTSAKDLTLDFRNDGGQTVRKYKSLTCRPVDGSLTGATEARQLLYCDDLVRDLEEAVNKDRLDFLFDKLLANVLSRKKEGCKELYIGTRWSLHDPLSRIERMHEGNPRFKAFKLPALDPETDESNFDFGNDAGFTTAYYHALRKMYMDNNDETTWQCVYQQNPIERDGLLFPREKLTFVHSYPDPQELPPDDIFAFCDVAFGGDDYLCMPIAYQWGDDPPVIVDAVFLRGGYRDTEPVVLGKILRHGVRRVVFEANNGGDFYSKDIADMLKVYYHTCSVTSVRAPSNKSKEARIFQYSPDIMRFAYLVPDQGDAMYRQYLENLTTYVMYGKQKNDDAPDATAGLASMLRHNRTAKVEVFDRRYL